jgi:hypothetical protein
LISAEKARTPVSMACRLLGVSRSGYYEWAANVASERAVKDVELVERIVEIHGAHRGVYGSPRIHAELRMAHGIRVGTLFPPEPSASCSPSAYCTATDERRAIRPERGRSHGDLQPGDDERGTPTPGSLPR